MQMRFYVFALCMIAMLLPMGGRAQKNVKPFVVPELKEWKGAEGHFLPSQQTRIVWQGTDPASEQVARQLAADYETLFGVKLPVVQGKAGKGDILLRLASDKQLGEEGYRMKIADRVTMTAYQKRGLFWATRTLLQLAEQQEGQSLPKGEIRDLPEYPIRGFMIDCGRKYIPISFLRDYVRILSYYKMNTFQIHLNDNGFKQFFNHDWSQTYAAFRLQSDTYPGLAAPDGHYSKQEFVDLQLLADSLGVEIIPEIDVPAHSLAFTHYCPEIGSQEYGMDHLNLFKPQTYQFVDALFNEYLEGDQPVFRGKRVHIGTDEYSNKKKEVVEKFRAFTDHYIRLVESYGKQACVWGALTHAKGDTPVKSDNVLMSAWYNGYAEPREMMKQGYQLLSVPDDDLYIVPATGYYNDYLNSRRLYEGWTPAHIGKELFEEQHPQISGGMFAVWNDHCGNGITVKDIHYRTLPAVQTLAVKMWTGQHTSLPYDSFERSVGLLSEAPGIQVVGRAKQPGYILQLADLLPGQTTGVKEIGYRYRVEFELDPVCEEKGTLLFSSPDAQFYLSDPIEGKMGFVREGYLNNFNYYVREGKRVKVTVAGDQESTSLYIDGELREKMAPQRCWFNSGKDSINYMRTLVFPLQQAGRFKSKVKNLKVHGE